MQKHSISGAKVTDIINEIFVYDMMTFKEVIFSVGGNDASSEVDDACFEEKYDQLISQIKTPNRECKIYLCKIAPRRDTDVTKHKRGIDSENTGGDMT